jgi:DNA repair protein RadD
MSRPQLRDYQSKDLIRINDTFTAHQRRVCYVLATGGGKTVVAAEFLRRQPDDQILVLAHRDEIVRQISEALAKLNIVHGIIAPGHRETGDRVQVASVMTVVRRLKRITPPTLVWIDEAHHAAARSWRRILAAWPNADLIGTTATPRRLDGKPLDDIFDSLVVGPSVARLIDAGWLAPCVVYTPARSPDLSQVAIRMGDYAQDQLARAMSGTLIVNGVVEQYERICRAAPALAFCVTIEHSCLVAEAFRRRGYRAEHVDGETALRERRAHVRALAQGAIHIITNCNLFTEGIDLPGVECVIGLRPTKSLALYLQMCGRALRPGEKKTAVILDSAGNVYRHGLPTARRRWTLRGRQVVEDCGDLLRCAACGAVNAGGAEECAQCGEPFAREHMERTVVAGPALAEAIEVPATDEDLKEMTYRSVLTWAAGKDGLLIASRLKRIAAARGYKPGWAFFMANCELDEVLAHYEAYRGTNT